MLSDIMIFLLLVLMLQDIAGDTSVFGVLELATVEMSTEPPKCYSGFQYTHCKANYPDDDGVMQNIAYFYLDFTWGRPYCLQCCGGNPVDVWDLDCEFDSTPSNLYGAEIRFWRNLFPGDKERVVCPVKRSACIYNETSGAVLECDVRSDATYLVGITVTIDIIVQHGNFETWNTITACNVESHESNVSLIDGDYFKEIYIMNHIRGPYMFQPFHAVLLSLLSILSIFFFLYYCRSAHCVVCNKKLIFFVQRCYLCRFYGAQLPDPQLMKALEEKSKPMRGSVPDNFPGIGCCFECMSAVATVVTCGYCCCCIKCLRKRYQILPSDKDSITSTVDMGDEKPNPHLIKQHPYFLHKAIDHPNPPEPPQWVKDRRLNTFDSADTAS